VFPIVLCPNSKSDPWRWLDTDEQKKALDQVHRLWDELILEREMALQRVGRSVNCSPSDCESHHEQELRRLFATCFPGTRFSPLERQCSSECVPLNECVLAIAWDSATTSLECLANLLPRAAVYQSNHQEVVIPYPEAKEKVSNKSG